jgi:60 kDa SS-A/Ro ribonucleoprotein
MLYSNHLQSVQLEQARPDQVKNTAGGYVFSLTPQQRLMRFLVLGCEGGTYYASERSLSRENATCVTECLDADGPGTVELITTVSEAGRAPKNDPAIFALAMACSHADRATRVAALHAVPRVCRIGTHLFQFVAEVKQMRGWGRGLRKCIEHWYKDKHADRLAYQLVKYQQRGGWSHRDVMRLCHMSQDVPKNRTAAMRWARKMEYERKHLPGIIKAFEKAKTASTSELVHLILDHKLTREMVPTESLQSIAVWEALLHHMPIGAMVRNLGKMSQVGLLKPLSSASAVVCGKLADATKIHKARLHPLALLCAQMTYASGHGVRGSLSWQPVAQITDALDGAFYHAFGAVKPSNKRTLLALDVSGSMDWDDIMGTPGLTPRVASAAMAMVTARTEPSWDIMAFSHQLVPVDVTPRMRLSSVVSRINRIQMGGTDCSLPMLYAQKRKLDVDTFIVYTDNETWAGEVHPFEALKSYRKSSGIDAKLIVVGMTATEFTIADPLDAGMLDVVGFDTAAPTVMADFARGEV